ncbi:hypothetical protein C0J52_28113 [Blattella germanica]|nr:hypothetical protein C0J52_28113 [Blattella germanica]
MIEDILVLIIPHLLFCDINNNNSERRSSNNSSTSTGNNSCYGQNTEIESPPKTETSFPDSSSSSSSSLPSSSHGIPDYGTDDKNV